MRTFGCLLVLAACSHCIAEHGAELTRNVQQAAQAELPLSDTTPCDNESGCICKGATLGDSYVLIFAQTDDLVSPIVCEAYVSAIFQADVTLHFCPYSAPTFTRGGVTARALLQSFQV